MTRPTKMLWATLALGVGLGAAGVAHAAPQDNSCWGKGTRLFAQVDDGQSGIGEHASSPPGFTPGDGGREGVGNVSMDIAQEENVGDGAHGNHLDRVAGAGQAGITLPEECQGLDDANDVP